MKKKHLIIILIYFISSSFQTKKFIDNYDSKLKITLNYILTTIVNSDLKKLPYKVDKNNLTLYVNLRKEKDLFRNSNLTFDIQLWRENNFDVKTNYEFNGIKIYFGNTKRKFIKMFKITSYLENHNKTEKEEFKTIDNNKPKKEKNEIQLITENPIRDPLTETNIYFNHNLEITYIDREQFIPILKKEISFDSDYYDE
ncbi:hypothetical protein BTO06_12140 [Tenacibaculum sp. SZ-18]|uniref:hypothetical protein n=1 Tax=Tenacibaculum sp. SZ-18 TaxID=754423 RepID=UPI000C2D2704|nr:hypothetical protein [Tenacibaculum sp. SZ-18]AUC15854.1 hypothetical protein BTO06_12140 [Tenacibaculum sp. SZ-18]